MYPLLSSLFYAVTTGKVNQSTLCRVHIQKRNEMRLFNMYLMPENIAHTCGVRVIPHVAPVEKWNHFVLSFQAYSESRSPRVECMHGLSVKLCLKMDGERHSGMYEHCGARVFK